MPLHVRVDSEAEVIYVKGRGRITDLDLLDYVREYLLGPDLETYDELFDLSEADLLDVTYAGLSAVASAAAATDPDGKPTKIAILVSETHGLGISRLYQTLREARGGLRATRVFLDGVECREWLGIAEGGDGETGGRGDSRESR